MSEFINNSAKRKKKIADALKRIHQGESAEQVLAEFADVLRNASASEISDIEQSLIADGMPIEVIQYLCDAHVAVFKESLDHSPPVDMLPGHPIYSFRAENEMVALLLNDLKMILSKGGEDIFSDESNLLTEKFLRLKEFNAHYERKENILFPYLEKVDFTGPSSVMWGIHDEIRGGWKEMISALGNVSTDPPDRLRRIKGLFSEIENKMREMIYKEEKILFPAALERLTQADWLAMATQEDEIGFCYIQRGNEWPGSKNQRNKENINKKHKTEVLEMKAYPLSTGDLSISQMNLMLTHLPVDITYVDMNDEVRFYSETPNRIFKRTAAIIGRKVQNCHPPASMGKVQEILDDFRAGKRENAEFWIQMDGLFIHIEYFALRDQDGAYQGALEVSQEITHLRELEGEKRLLS